MYLDNLVPFFATVGWGTVGRRGELGYDQKHVTVGGQTYAHALSAHAPAQLMFDLAGRYTRFRSRVAINDDVPSGWAQADFHVLADGRRVAVAEGVAAGAGACDIEADITGARTLELAVRAPHRDHVHSVWLEPYLEPHPNAATTFVDCLGRAEIELRPLPPAARCIATVVTPGFEAMLADMLGSLRANGGCVGATLLVFVVGTSEGCDAVAARYGATVVRCRSVSKAGTAIKSILYSIAHVIEARHYVCLDADMLIAAPLDPLFAALEVLPEKSILVCRDCNTDAYRDLRHVLEANYGGNDWDAALLEMTDAERSYPLVVNDGLFAGGRAALLSLDSAVRGIPQAAQWMDARDQAPLRNQFLFNLALARLNAGVRIDDTWNLQLHAQDAEWDRSTRRTSAAWNGRAAHVVHFSGNAKRKYPFAQGHYAAAQPLLGPAPGDGYAEFLETLRAWLGVEGADALRWSFYGTTTDSFAVRDTSVFPLLATLHYLIRSNGCVRVLEAGTARGVSAACIASAIAHREGGRIVTFDPVPYAGRDELWNALPPRMRACIEPRAIDSVAGMMASLENGERFHAALLDSLHVEEHVLAEFELARQLVCANGLILIHDATYARGTVGRALERIERDGYNVTRLWTAEEGEREDDALGLAVIENRRRS
jgi:NPCBM/NEW2 domain/Methyltransferase domain